MKVLISCLSQSWGGMEMYTLTSLLKLTEKNIDTELLCYKNSRLHKEAINLGIKTSVSNASGYFSPGEITKLASLIELNKYSLIHTHASKDLWLLVPSLKFASSSIPLILTKHVGSFIVKKDFFHKWIYNRVDCALAISQVIKKNLIDTTPLKVNKVKLLYDGINVDKFNPAQAGRKKIRNEFNIESQDIVIGMMARFSPGKGHEEFIRAAEIVSSKYNNLKFMIVGEPSRGEDSYGAEIKSLAENSIIKNKIIFTGFRKDTPDILAAMDIFAFPSHAEALGMALIEAMAMGIPSVCSKSDGVLDIAVDNVTSYLFEKQNTHDLADKLEQLIASPVKREEFGKAARERVIKNFDINLVTGQVVDIYNELIKRKLKL